MHDFLVDHAPNEREKQRLRRVAQPHACGYITAVPSDEDGKHILLRPRLFGISVAYRLGVPVLNDCASSQSMFTAIMPFAAHRKGTLSFDTTHCATLLKALLQTVCSLQWLK